MMKTLLCPAVPCRLWLGLPPSLPLRAAWVLSACFTVVNWECMMLMCCLIWCQTMCIICWCCEWLSLVVWVCCVWRPHPFSPGPACCSKQRQGWGTTWGPFHERFFHHNFRFDENSFCPHLSCNDVIAMKFCTWHDSCAVVPCAKFCSDMTSYNGVILKPICHRIWITMEKSFMKWAPGQPANGALGRHRGNTKSTQNTLPTSTLITDWHGTAIEFISMV